MKPSFLDFEEKQIEYITLGNFSSNSPVLILLHEGLGSVAMWRDIPKLIHEKTKMNILVYSRFGYGKSSKAELPRPTNYMSVEAEKYLPIILQKLSITKYVLIGHSDGATIAALGSINKSNRELLGTILIAPHFFVENESIRAIEETTDQYINKKLKNKLEKYHNDVDNAFFGWSNVWLSSNFKEWNVSNYLSEIKIPVLIIQGTNDPYGTINQVQILEDKLKSKLRKVIIENCGHNPFHEFPEMTIKCIDKFIKKLL